MAPTVFQPEVLFAGGRLQPGGQLVVADDGSVLAAAPPGARVVKLPGKLMLPGLVNAHSHAFQRLLRGRTEYVAKGREADDFWSWRELMYRTANALDPAGVFVASRQAFLEMALAGITTVGEFHYLHHQPDGTPYADVHELAKQVARAAREVGLRIVLLRVGYARAGFEQPANPLQRRFCDPDPDTFVHRTLELRRALAGDPAVSVGFAPHSVRAVPRGWLEAVARHPGEVTHLHVAEQPAEIKACLAEHGRRPVELLEEVGLLHPKLTAVHAIHLSPSEIEALGRAKASVCACPSTERNLGDGVVPADALMRAGVTIALGTDSQADIHLLDDARQLEGHLRLVRGRRAVLDPGGGALSGLAERLLRCTMEGGARSLGLDVGALTVGQPADFFTVDLAHPCLVGAPREALLPAVVFGAATGAVSEVAVGGKLLVEAGRHPLTEEIGRDFAALVSRTP
ncbi:MAG: hutF [Myxococcaceae bacterium]|nr:hutF [Myxococcaceae bacterium]